MNRPATKLLGAPWYWLFSMCTIVPQDYWEHYLEKIGFSLMYIEGNRSIKQFLPLADALLLIVPFSFFHLFLLIRRLLNWDFFRIQLSFIWILLHQKSIFEPTLEKYGIPISITLARKRTFDGTKLNRYFLVWKPYWWSPTVFIQSQWADILYQRCPFIAFYGERVFRKHFAVFLLQVHFSWF